MAGITWRPAGSKVHGVSAVYVAVVPRTPVTLMWMNQTLLKYRYVPGSSYPEHGPVLPADRTPHTWVPNMVAAFNGGFHLADNVGGYFYAGTLVKPMRSGFGSFVINGQGHLEVDRWSPAARIAPGTKVVRQNLPLLVEGGKSRATTKDGVSTWGIVTYRRPVANRSALGQLPNGSLIFALAHETTALVLADEMVRAGVRSAVMLDMNGDWPTGFIYDLRQGGGPPVGHKIAPWIVRPPATYLKQFKKDFVVAEMAPSAPGVHSN